MDDRRYKPANEYGTQDKLRFTLDQQNPIDWCDNAARELALGIYVFQTSREDKHKTQHDVKNSPKGLTLRDEKAARHTCRRRRGRNPLLCSLCSSAPLDQSASHPDLHPLGNTLAGFRPFWAFTYRAALPPALRIAG
jgi:hypothetical protein